MKRFEETLHSQDFDNAITEKHELEDIFGKYLDEIINNHLSGKKLSDIRR